MTTVTHTRRKLSSSLPEKVEGVIRGIDEAQDISQVCEVLSVRLGQMGFRYFAYWMIWPPSGQRKPFYISNYPGKWSEHYLKEGYASHDYVGRHAATRTVPFFWSELTKKITLTKQQKLVFDEARTVGLYEGGTVPIHGPGAGKATFSVAGDMGMVEFQMLFLKWRHEIHLMATYAHEKIITFNFHDPAKSTIKLSPRETEILTWCAKGKSIWEVSMILGLSEDTVKEYLKNTRTKLNASNTTHAIAVALMHGLILP